MLRVAAADTKVGYLILQRVPFGEHYHLDHSDAMPPLLSTQWNLIITMHRILSYMLY